VLYRRLCRNQTIVSFDSLAGKYDDLFSRSRIGTQRALMWEVSIAELGKTRCSFHYWTSPLSPVMRRKE
jgi:Txe/YoeB family toxin of Txe-Axe toxin-antitoxin module